MNSNEIRASLILSSWDGLGPMGYQEQIKRHGSAIKVLEAEPKLKANEAWADQELKECDSQGICLLAWQSPAYPKALKEISDAPPIIYVKGDPARLETVALALVGSRGSSYYGELVAWEFAQGLATLKIPTVSGLARGIDSVVHKATLEAGGITWAVLGSGLLRIYPPENKSLAQRIQDQGGVVLSEFPLHTAPHAGNFPKRNRIIAGLSVGTVVIEGSDKSGSLITARLAAKEGREVLAVPGPVHSPLSQAPNRLIQNGAMLVQSVDDILQALPGYIQEELQPKKNVEVKEDEILKLFESTPVPLEWVSERLNQSPSELSARLLSLELKGLIKTLPGGMLVRKHQK